MNWLILFILLAVPEWALAQSVNIRNGNAPGIAGVMNSAPVGTEYGLVVRCIGCSGVGGGGLTDTQLRATPVPVSGTFWQATQPVSGTFFQATQPVSGTFWQVTQPVSGTFWQATQPVSAVALPLPPNAAQETGGNLATLAGKDFSTSAQQDTGNTSLASIDAKIPALDRNTVPVTVEYSRVLVAPVIPPGANRLQYSALMQGYCRQTLCPPLPGGLR